MNNEKEDGLVITRSFDAQRIAVWKAWTKPAQLMRWWGPRNLTAPVFKNDFQVGGKYLGCMRSAEGQEFWITGIYKEIISLEKIVFTDSFADKKGNVVPASYYGMPGDQWPIELYVTITFEDLAGKTKMTLSHVGIPSVEMREMTGVSWNESFDKLAESLS